MEPTEDAKLKILNDHYKDTFACLQESRRARDRYFAFVVSLAALQLFLLAAPNLIERIVEQLVSSQIGIQTKIDISLLESVVWFVLLGISIRYYQVTASLERQYDYIHMLEETLSKFFDTKAFTREGKFYLTKFPTFTNGVSILYMWVSPILLIAIVMAKIVAETTSNPMSVYLVFDGLVALAIIVFTALYLRMIHDGK
jgi:hypothetical protein